MNESFWEAQGVEIEPCAIFEHFVVLPVAAKFAAADKKIPDSMLGVLCRSSASVGGRLMGTPDHPWGWCLLIGGVPYQKAVFDWWLFGPVGRAGRADGSGVGRGTQKLMGV